MTRFKYNQAGLTRRVGKPRRQNRYEIMGVKLLRMLGGPYKFITRVHYSLDHIKSFLEMENTAVRSETGNGSVRACVVLTAPRLSIPNDRKEYTKKSFLKAPFSRDFTGDLSSPGFIATLSSPTRRDKNYCKNVIHDLRVQRKSQTK